MFHRSQNRALRSSCRDLTLAMPVGKCISQLPILVIDVEHSKEIGRNAQILQRCQHDQPARAVSSILTRYEGVQNLRQLWNGLAEIRVDAARGASLSCRANREVTGSPLPLFIRKGVVSSIGYPRCLFHSSDGTHSAAAVERSELLRSVLHHRDQATYGSESLGPGQLRISKGGIYQESTWMSSLFLTGNDNESFKRSSVAIPAMNACRGNKLEGCTGAARQRDRYNDENLVATDSGLVLVLE
ncbi:hypothetical protein J6590_012296 [Homalodisca vitripennis]|nr:hypothetical protein J6590_012296 [Homalodisca vitripennis]